MSGRERVKYTLGQIINYCVFLKIFCQSAARSAVTVLPFSDPFVEQLGRICHIGQIQTLTGQESLKYVLKRPKHIIIYKHPVSLLLSLFRKVDK